MKKILVLAVFTVLGFTNVNAQKIKFGVKGGLNFATVSGDNTENIDYVTSYHFGVLSEIPISEKFSFQPELMYSRQGYSFGDDIVALNYLNIPLMGKYYMAHAPMWTVQHNTQLTASAYGTNTHKRETTSDSSHT